MYVCILTDNGISRGMLNKVGSTTITFGLITVPQIPPGPSLGTLSSQLEKDLVVM